MLVLTDLSSPYPRKIIYDDLSQITIKSSLGDDITRSLYDSHILSIEGGGGGDPDDPGTENDYLVKVFGADWAFPASVALDIPLNSTDRLLL